MKMAIFYKINDNYYFLANEEKDTHKNTIDPSISIVTKGQIESGNTIFTENKKAIYRKFG